ncbi:MAG: UTP--glucose-1-phosphate uridylyltransferase GalU [Coxiellaceae bacterium]|nr:UTP--glucose-1-phosphate uridylyltransferase GalU [Coxiellaceae bacterium]
MTKKIEVAVFPVAGLGTRFLPVTKAGPKEMLPIVDKPLIQYVVEEALSAGIKELVLVTSSSKRAIEDYFDTNYELESRLESLGKYEVLSTVKNILPADVSLAYVRQMQPRGLGDAVLCAKHVVGDRPFAVLLADDIIDGGERSCMQDMVSLYDKTQSSVLAVEEIPPSETNRYGIVSLARHSNAIEGIVEKPDPSVAPSNLAVTGRYILTPRIFELLEQTSKGVGGEIQLTDAIATLLKEQKVMAFPFNGRRYDCGSRVGFLEATIAYALKRPELRERLQVYLTELVEKDLLATTKT